MGEFDLIERYFTRPARHAVLGVGDDCALLALASGMQLALSTDMLVEGRHFLSTVNPVHLGHKALALFKFKHGGLVGDFVCDVDFIKSHYFVQR